MDSVNIDDELLSTPENSFSKGNRSNFIDQYRSFLSKSILKKYSDPEILKLNWVYNQMLLMHFLRPNIYDLLRNLDQFDVSFIPKESLLNYFIDLYCNKFPNEVPQQPNKLNKEFFEKDLNQITRNFSFQPYNSGRKSLVPLKIKSCPICFLDYELNVRTIPTCFHHVCLTCFNSYVSFHILSGNVNMIRCPIEGCLITLKEDYLLNILTGSILEKYEKFKLDWEVLINPYKKWCIRPNCNTYIQKEREGGSNRMICPCGQTFCFLCNNPWHEGKTCEEAIDEDYIKYEANVLVKHCPKCGWKIEKNQGCNHMHCRCGYHFCWLCLSDYQNGYCVKKCPKFTEENNQINNRLFLEEQEWEMRVARFNEERWSWFDESKSFKGKFKVFIAFIISFLCLPVILIILFYGTIIFGLVFEPFFKIRRMIVGIDDYPIDTELNCNNLENVCDFFAFLPFFLFMNILLTIVYLITQLLFFIEKHVFTNFVKYFIIVKKTHNVFGIFSHLKVFIGRNMPNEQFNQLQELKSIKLFASFSLFFFLALNLSIGVLI